MGAVVLVFELISLIIVCGLVLRIFASFKKTPWYAIATTWLGWLLCFAIVLLVPIDIIDADHEQCMKNNNGDMELCKEPIGYLPPPIMRAQWSVLYWGTFIMSWLGFPILQTYSLAGDFTVWEKFVRSVKENIYIYIAMAIVGSIFLIALAITVGISLQDLLKLVMALANAYGLILVVVLMGYGLVDIPRYLLRKASRDKMLEHYHAQICKNKETMETAKEDLTKTLQTVKRIADRVKESDPLREYVDKILEKCPMEYEEVTGEDGDSGDITYAKLVSLNCRVKEDTHAVARAVCLYEMVLRKAFATEDIIRIKEEKGSPDRKLHYSFRPPRTYKYAYVVDTLEYFWAIYFHPLWYYALFAGATILSILIVWCEITLPVNKNSVDLSPFSQMIKAADMRGFGKQLFCFIPLSYMALCAYTTLFKIRLFNYYRLVPHKQSDANSIMFSANYLCRLAAPLSFNFLKLVNVVDSSFNKVMGEMDAFPFLGEQFTIFFPIFVAILCLFSLFRVWGKIGSMCCIKKLRYIPDDDIKLVTEGEKILRDERAAKEGRAPTNKSFTAEVKGMIRKATKKLTPGKATDESNNNNGAPPPTPQAAAPNAVLTQKQTIANKYLSSRYDDGAELPSSSKFAASSTGGNRSSNYDALPATSRFANQDSLLPPTSRFSREDALLPPNSRFSKNAAILDGGDDTSAKSFAKSTQMTSPSSSSSSSTQKSVFGSLFGGKKNDEVGLLGFSNNRSDSLV